MRRVYRHANASAYGVASYELILDGFLGSGTTAAGARKIRRAGSASS